MCAVEGGGSRSDGFLLRHDLLGGLNGVSVYKPILECGLPGVFLGHREVGSVYTLVGELYDLWMRIVGTANPCVILLDLLGHLHDYGLHLTHESDVQACGTSGATGADRDSAFIWTVAIPGSTDLVVLDGVLHQALLFRTLHWRKPGKRQILAVNVYSPFAIRRYDFRFTEALASLIEHVVKINVLVDSVFACRSVCAAAWFLIVKRYTSPGSHCFLRTAKLH